MTNREWLASLSDEQLAEFCTSTLYVTFVGQELKDIKFPLSVRHIAQRTTSSIEGFKEWLNKEQEFEVLNESIY